MSINDAPIPPSSLVKPSLIGFCVIAFGVMGFLAWSLLTPLDSAVVAQGVVKVGSEKKQVQHLEGGIVKSLYVKEGDEVEAGQVLLTLDETFAGTDFTILTTQLLELKIREAKLTAQRDELEELSFPQELNSQTENAWLSQQMVSATRLFELSQAALNSQLSAITSQRHQLSEKSAGYEREIVAKKEEIDYMEEELGAWENLIERQYANKLRFLELKRELSESKGELAQLETQLISSKAQMEELAFEHSRVEQAYREAAAGELVDVQLNIKDLSKRIDSASNVLGRIDVKAPVTGKVVGLMVYTIGAVISPGETILEIVPAKDELVIGAQIRPVDIDKVHQSMSARVRIASYKMHEFPEFEGRVDSVSADVFEDPKTLNSYYTARIAIPETTLVRLPKDKINPGMPADVMIITGESTPAQYLMDPLITAFRTAWRDE